jgi:hypothetical protein
MQNLTTPNIWSPIAGFRALKISLAFAVECKQRVYQLEYVAAFLLANVIGRKFTIFPSGWKELLKDYPDLHQWFGVPLRLRKSLYGDRVANLAWDETQSQWLTSAEIGFTRLLSEGSIYLKRTTIVFIVVLNAVDDQLYFATLVSLNEWFEKANKETTRRPTHGTGNLVPPISHNTTRGLFDCLGPMKICSYNCGMISFEQS